MKTTLDLPDDLMRAVKMQAVKEDKKLKELIAELLRLGLARRSGRPLAIRRRVALPLVECAHDARPDQEMTPARVAEELLAQEMPPA